MELSELLGILSTYIGPALVAAVTVWIQYKKNKADMIEIIANAKKIEKEGLSTEGDIFLKWTQEFRDRLETAENSNKEAILLVKEQGRTIELGLVKMKEQDDNIAKQSILLVDANARILILEKENLDLKETVLILKEENTLLKKRISELELENEKLRAIRNGNDC